MSKTHPPIEQRLLDGIEKDPKTNCWEWQKATTANGYGHLWCNGKLEYAHRISAMLYLNFNISSKMCVLHKCDNKPCINPKHLFIGTNQDNVTDKMKKGRGTIGEKHGLARLTEIQIRQIKKEYVPRIKTARALAKKYKVSQKHIYQIVHNKRWRHI